MSAFEDEDGIEGPFNRAMNRAMREDQKAHLERVSARIGALIVSFCRDRLATKRPDFHMHELTSWLALHVNTAPDSASRILRHLKAKNVVRYDLVSRRSSLYRVTKVGA